MTNDKRFRPSSSSLPGELDAAYRWLLACPSKTPPHEVRRRARCARLHIGSGNILEGLLTAMTRRALRRRLPVARELAGLGQIAAWTHSDIEQLVSRAFNTRRPRPEGRALVEGISRSGAPRIGSREDWQTSAIERFFAEAPLDQRLVDQATQLLGQFWEIRSNAYGLTFAIRIALAVSPASTLATLIRRPEGAITSLVGAVGDALHNLRVDYRLVEALLRCESPLLRVMAAQALTGTEREATSAESMAVVHDRLLRAGWSAEDAHWIVAQRLKDLAHWRFQSRADVKALEAQLARDAPRSTRRSPAPRGAAASGVAQRLSDARRKLETAERGVATLISLLARTWPVHAVSEDILERLAPCIVNGSAIRLEVAEALPPGGARRGVLDEILLSFANLIGLRAPDEALDEYFVLTGPEATSEIQTAARAHVLRHESDPSIGKSAGLRITALSKVAQAVLSRPFSRARNALRHQSAMARLACALDFALNVAILLRGVRDAEAATLAGLALKHATGLFCFASDDEEASPHLERLAVAAIWAMRVGLVSDGRATWACNPDLPPFVRALAAWTDAAFVAEQRELADELFALAGRPALDMRIERFSYHAAVTLLDAALATHRLDPITIDAIRASWTDVEQAFAPYGKEHWAANVLLDAAASLSILNVDPVLRRMALAQNGQLS